MLPSQLGRFSKGVSCVPSFSTKTIFGTHNRGGGGWVGRAGRGKEAGEELRRLVNGHGRNKFFYGSHYFLLCHSHDFLGPSTLI